MENFWTWLGRLRLAFWVGEGIVFLIPTVTGILAAYPIIWSMVAGVLLVAITIWAMYGIHLLRNRNHKTPKIPNSPITLEHHAGLKIQHDGDDSSYYWESPTFRWNKNTGEENLEIIRKRRFEGLSDNDFRQKRICRIKILNQDVRLTLTNVRVKIEQISPSNDKIKLPLEIRFTNRKTISIDLAPEESELVDVIYWAIPKNPQDYPDKFHLPVREGDDIPIDKGNYKVLVRAYGMDCNATETFWVGMKPIDGEDKICMWKTTA